jgi:hypothetical protein
MDVSYLAKMAFSKGQTVRQVMKSHRYVRYGRAVGRSENSWRGIK